MKQYAVTVVFIINADSEDEAKMVVSEVVKDQYLYVNKGESWDMVEISEVN